MAFISDLHRKKKGISVVVGYALLIGMGIALSVLVFQWLRYYVDSTDDTDLHCDEGTNLIITDVTCTYAPSKALNISLKNKGKFNIDGFVIRANNRIDAEQGIYRINEGEDQPLSLGETFNNVYDYSSITELDTIPFIEVQPYKIIEDKTIYCSFIDTQHIECESS